MGTETSDSIERAVRPLVARLPGGRVSVEQDPTSPTYLIYLRCPTTSGTVLSRVIRLDRVLLSRGWATDWQAYVVDRVQHEVNVMWDILATEEAARQHALAEAYQRQLQAATVNWRRWQPLTNSNTEPPTTQTAGTSPAAAQALGQLVGAGVLSASTARQILAQPPVILDEDEAPGPRTHLDKRHARLVETARAQRG